MVVSRVSVTKTNYWDFNTLNTRYFAMIPRGFNIVLQNNCGLHCHAICLLVVKIF